jgi:hypothetical protein
MRAGKHSEALTLARAAAASTEGDTLPVVVGVIAAGRAQLRVALPILYAAARQQLLPNATALDQALDH